MADELTLEMIRPSPYFSSPPPMEARRGIRPGIAKHSANRSELFHLMHRDLRRHYRYRLITEEALRCIINEQTREEVKCGGYGARVLQAKAASKAKADKRKARRS